MPIEAGSRPCHCIRHCAFCPQCPGEVKGGFRHTRVILSAIPEYKAATQITWQ